MIKYEILMHPEDKITAYRQTVWNVEFSRFLIYNFFLVQSLNSQGMNVESHTQKKAVQSTSYKHIKQTKVNNL